jgi:hypothetical protein
MAIGPWQKSIFLKLSKKFWYTRYVELGELIIFYIGNIYLKLKLRYWLVSKVDKYWEFHLFSPLKSPISSLKLNINTI